MCDRSEILSVLFHSPYFASEIYCYQGKKTEALDARKPEIVRQLDAEP